MVSHLVKGNKGLLFGQDNMIYLSIDHYKLQQAVNPTLNLNYISITAE
jgi:hypothetical protein